MNQKQLILASASPRRRDLFALTGLSADFLSVEVDERPHPAEDPVTFVSRLAREKGREAARRIVNPHLIMAADTIVIDEGQIIGKPEDPKEARMILKVLAGRPHQVITSLALVASETGDVQEDLCETTVPMRKYSSNEIKEYVAAGSPMDKAGAYGIQDGDFHPVDVDRMKGCYANVMGLPLCHLTRSIRQLGLEPKSNVPEACQSFTKYDCSVYPEILNFST